MRKWMVREGLLGEVAFLLFGDLTSHMSWVKNRDSRENNKREYSNQKALIC